MQLLLIKYLAKEQFKTKYVDAIPTSDFGLSSQEATKFLATQNFTTVSRLACIHIKKFQYH